MLIKSLKNTDAHAIADVELKAMVLFGTSQQWLMPPAWHALQSFRSRNKCVIKKTCK